MLKEHQIADADLRSTSLDDMVRERGVVHKDLYNKIVQSMTSEQTLYHLQKEQFELQLREKTARCEMAKILCSFYHIY